MTIGKLGTTIGEKQHRDNTHRQRQVTPIVSEIIRRVVPRRYCRLDSSGYKF